MDEFKEWVREHSKWIILIGGGVLVVVVGFMLFGHSSPNNQTTLPDGSSLNSSQSGSLSQSGSASLTSGTKSAGSGTSSTAMSTGPTNNSNTGNQAAFADVQGAVIRPGLYPVGATTRVADLIIQAGGLTAKADRQQINLAQKVSDQQVILVPEKGSSVMPPVGSGNGSPTVNGHSSSVSPKASAPGTGDSNSKVNLNSADLSQLQQLSGIGAKKAQKIIDFRNSHGPFKSVGDLQNVAGFGAKTVEKYQDQLTV